MKKGFLTILVAVIANSLSAQNVICVHGTSGTSFYKSLDSAVLYANAGDTVNLPGGGIDFNSGASNSYGAILYVNKELHFIGAGCDFDSSTATGVSAIPNIYFQQGSNNSSVTGVYVNGTIRIMNPINNIKITRCKISGNILCDSICNSFLITENILGTGNNPYGGGNYSIYLTGGGHFVSNNIFSAIARIDNSTIKNNISKVYNPFGANTSFEGDNNLFENNITNSIPCYTTNSTFKNNINCGPLNGIDGQNNQGFTTYYCEWNLLSYVNNLFISSSPVKIADYQFNPTNNTGLNYSILGTNGTAIGIFGGAFPMKMGQIPSNPHITDAIVAPQTNNNGELQINISTRAEQK